MAARKFPEAVPPRLASVQAELNALDVVTPAIVCEPFHSVHSIIQITFVKEYELVVCQLHNDRLQTLLVAGRRLVMVESAREWVVPGVDHRWENSVIPDV